MALDVATVAARRRPAAFDASLAAAVRTDLGSGAWLDIVEGWVSGADALFEPHPRRGALVVATSGKMFDRMVVEPRLTTRELGRRRPAVPAMADALSAHYGFDLHAVSANLYRNGQRQRGLARRPHRPAEGAETVVAIVSLGSPRRFLLRPRVAGRPSRRSRPGPGDLLVLGGTCQRTWQHWCPRSARPGPG